MVRFEIPGSPVPKERPRRSASGHYYTPARTRRYEQTVAAAAQVAGVSLDPQKRYRATAWFYVSRACDGDNCLKSILDALRLYGQPQGWDDRQVQEGHYYVETVPRGKECALVEIEPLEATA